MGDFRHAFRGLLKQRGFALVAILTLAFGIGVDVSLFGMLSAFFLQRLPVKDSERLVLVMQRGDVINIPYGYSYPDYLDFRRSLRTLSDLAAYTPMPAHVSARGQAPERTWIEVVSPNYFTLAAVAPALGAFPRGGDSEATGGAAHVVLSYRYWQRRFGGDPAVVGRGIVINGKSFTAVAVAPESFTGLSWAMAVSAWVPSGSIGALMNGGDAFRDNRGTPAFRLMGRLSPGRTLDEARAEVDVVAARLAAQFPVQHKNSRPMVIPENRARPDPSLAGFLPIFAAVFALLSGMVLLIACANVANLMLSRAVERQRDLAIRSAIGASRFRLMRLQLVESAIIASMAGVVGLLLAKWSGVAISAFVKPGDIPVNEAHGWDWRVYAFTFGASVVTAFAAGFWPARNASRFDLVHLLKQGTPGAGGGRHRLRNLLVVGQVTMSLVVLASAGLFMHSLRQVQHLALGFTPERLAMASIDLGLQQYSEARGRQFLKDLLARAEALPGVQSATVTVHVPFDYGMQFADVSSGVPVGGAKDEYTSTAFTVVGPRFFETAGLTLTRGRGFDTRDDEHSRRVAVVNERMARTLWPNADPIGRRFRFGRNGDWIDVVGVARDGKYVMLAEQPRPYFYLPLAQRYSSPVTIMVRASGDPAALAAPLQRLLAQMDPDLPVFNVRTMQRHIDDSVFGLMPLRLGASMAAALGALAMLLAVMGLYAVVSHAVTRRTREIGVRVALGARRADVLRLVMRDGMRLSLLGVAIGLAVAAALGYVLSLVLYGVAPFDVPVFSAIAALLLGVSALACYMPSRRATRVDPLVALRCD
jgi:predicted permease